MKKYLLIGLTILIGTNLVMLSGVMYNRMNKTTPLFSFTERELKLPYNYEVRDNSGLSLSFHWRMPTKEHDNYYSDLFKDKIMTQDELSSLGFEQLSTKNNYWILSRELYWALEFDGALYKAEVNKVKRKYATAASNYEQLPSKENKNIKNNYIKELHQEQKVYSRLFFVEAAIDYQSLATKYSTQKNIIIVKGLAKPFYNSSNKTYSLRLRQPLIKKIMIPLEFTTVFSGFKRQTWNGTNPPRYTVDIKWGNRLEPWVVSANRIISDK